MGNGEWVMENGESSEKGRVSLVPALALPLGEWERTPYQLPITNYQLPITNYQLPITLAYFVVSLSSRWQQEAHQGQEIPSPRLTDWDLV